MPRKIFALSLFLLLLTSASAFALDFTTKPKLAFFPFLSQSVDAISFTEGISTQLFNNIERTDFFEIMERKQVESAIAQDGIPLAAMSKENLFAIGNRVGFDLCIIGQVSRADNAALIDLQVIGSGSRGSYYSETFRVSEFELPKKLQEIADKIVVKVKGFDHAPAPAEKSIAGPTALEIRGTPKSIKLKWTPPGSRQVIGYAILRANSPAGSFVQIATTTEPAYTDANLKLNETFYYQVKAIGKNGIECRLSEAVIGKTSVAPHPPIFMEIKTDPAGALLSWYDRPYSGDNANLVTSGFQIYRKARKEKEYLPLAKVGPKVQSYLDDAMKNGVVYSYALTSFNARDVESEFSSILEASSAQAAGGIQASSGGKRKVLLKWTPNDSELVDGYNVYRSQQADGVYQRIAQLRGRTSNFYLDAELEDGRSYYYRLAGVVSGNAETPRSEPVSATTGERPAPPARFSATGGQARKVTLRWKSGKAEDEIEGYRLFRATSPEGEYLKIAEIPKNRDSYTDDRQKAATEKSYLTRFASMVHDGSVPLADGTTYYYRISCFNEVGSESVASETVSATTKVAPPAPKHVTASNGQVKKVTVSWEQSSEGVAKEYQVYRGIAGQKEVQELANVREPFFVDTSLPDGALYIYAVKQVDSDDIASPLSFPATGGTKSRPAVPRALALTERDGIKGIAWQSNREKDLTLYVVYKKSLGLFHKLRTVDTNFLPLDGLKGSLELRVVAEDRDGLESEESEIIKLDLE